ncbi:MAG: zinc protease [Maribacter sp.]|jgi:zinc protease
MVEFKRFKLDNGLVVIVHEDESTPLAAVNLLYNVGARDELEEKTGFAHLFEHLMFSGSANVPDFDAYIQNAGGDSNAFTNNDITNYYDTIPAANLETALWLEADRMSALNINKRSLDVQRKVVVEEFNETCLNIPYGDAWHKIASMAFRKHPYRWPTIGLVPQHIQDAELEDVQYFYKKHYSPNNAVLVVAGNVKTDEVKVLVEKHFGRVPANKKHERKLPEESPQIEERRTIVTADVPLDAIYMVFHMVDRVDDDFYSIDLLSDILCNGKSSRMYKTLKKKLHLFADIDSYVTGNFDPGLLVIEGRLAEEVTIEKAEAAIWEVINEVKNNGVTENELQKYKNKAISGLIFNECNLLNRAMTLAFFETLGDANIMNEEPDKYKNKTLADINRVANQYLTKENCSVLIYKRKEEEPTEA